MARAPQSTGVSKEQFKDAPEWFMKFVDLLNPFMADVATALAGNLDRSNFKKQVEPYTIATSASLSDTFTGNKIRFKCRLGPGVKPVEVRIGQIRQTSPAGTVSAAVGLEWEYTQAGEILINYIAGLSTSTTYELTFIVE